ncbi:DNA-binding SARP family transcriptional activator [Micromonospora luteifusca]|uniref:DNA-binding SARP family transcriptional activator n=1 Tax=Micromonospora luteifusca TaxID=709860 RepID=A0ABS2LNB0_9ACTN|nr:AfsR/SARP family transcriptional regulator [Micromonospora luteifusca]MBM7489368.1 DNA-binding SARP family transcriptional activator [Micromonospora luteifusca]
MGYELRVTLFGTSLLQNGHQRSQITRAQNRGLLALLALNANIFVTYDWAIEALWGGRPPSSARTQIHTGVHAIRRALRKLAAEDLLTSNSCGYALRIDPGQVDATLFERKVQQARSASAVDNHDEATTLLEEGLALWSGPALGDAAGAFVAGARQRLDQQRASAIEDLIALEMRAGRHTDVVDRFSAVIDQFPLRERLRGQLMLAQFRAGNKVAAIENYQQFRTQLADKIGLDPSPQLRALQHAIIRDDISLDGSAQQFATPFDSAIPVV